MCIYVCGGVCICEWGCACAMAFASAMHAWGGQMTALDMGSYLPPCLRQALLFTAVYLSIVGLWDSTHSHLHFRLGSGALVFQHPVVCGFCPSDAGSHTCVASPWPVELSSQPKKQSFLKKSLWSPKPCKSESNVKDVSLYITYNPQAKNFRQCENMLNKGIKLMAKQWLVHTFNLALRR